jgi:hypothetical protein
MSVSVSVSLLMFVDEMSLTYMCYARIVATLIQLDSPNRILSFAFTLFSLCAQDRPVSSDGSSQLRG